MITSWILVYGVLVIMWFAMSSPCGSAASYGRMGGSASSSPSSSSSSSGSFSRSSSITSSYMYNSKKAVTDQYKCNSKEEDLKGVVFYVYLVLIITGLLLALGVQDLHEVASSLRESGDKDDDIVKSVLMLQFGFWDKTRRLQKEINRIAKTADTSTPSGLNYVLQEVLNVMLQHCASCRFAHLIEQCGESTDSMNLCYEKILSSEIRRYDKDEETFVNADGVKIDRAVNHKANGVDNEYSVVTILLFVGGKYAIPSLKLDTTQGMSVLQLLLSIPSSKLKKIEVLWTPQREDETVSKQEVLRDFPDMVKVKPLDVPAR